MKRNIYQNKNIHNLDNIPNELKVLKQWVCWNSTKFPINARTGNKAEVNNPDTWCTFEEAREGVLSGKYKGVGFVLTKDDPYVIIDLDHVIDPDTGEIQPWAQKIIDRMDSYTEISQSGTGIHIIVRGKKPGDRCKSRNGQVEIYDHSRYFALTASFGEEAS
jgi:putative DNA primase/helicase